MGESVRALIVILALSAPVLWMAQAPLAATAIEAPDYKRRALAWLALLTLAFLSNNYWIYAFVAACILIALGRVESNRFSLFVFLLFLIPPFPARIPGFGGLNQIFELTHPRLLAIFLLVPVWLSLRREANVQRFGSSWADVFLICFLMLQLILQWLGDTFTNTVRYAFYAFVDVFLPYYAASRSTKDIKAFKDIIASIVMSILLLSPIAGFEFLKHWLLYYGLQGQMGVESWAMGAYLQRGESLRALATTGHSLVLGYVMVVGVALASFTSNPLPRKWKNLVSAALAIGLLAPVSRGPWVGAATVLGVLALTGPNRMSRVGKSIAIGMPLVALLLVSPAGPKIIDLLPFIGTVDEFNVTYRQRLVDASMAVIQHNFWLGSSNFMTAPEMQEMIQGEGIIDIVNSYIGVALSYGVVGLGLFCGVFITGGWGVIRGLGRLQVRDELHTLGRALLAALVGALVTIATVSSINNIAVVYWMLAGLCVGYTRLVRQTQATGSPSRKGSRLDGRNSNVPPKAVGPLPTSRAEWPRHSQTQSRSELLTTSK